MDDIKKIESLLAKTALNDQDAFEKLYDLTSPRLFGFALQMLKKKELAEEVIQDAFVKIWYNANQYHHERGSPLAWMTGIVRYRAIDLLRSRRDMVDIDTITQGVATENDGTGLLDVQDDLTECLDELQEKQKKSILMAYCEGYTHQELAGLMSVPLGTMKSWIRRSLDKLKRCLDGLR